MIKSWENPSTKTTTVSATYTDMMQHSLGTALIPMIAEKLADQLIEQRGQEILAKINVDAIANLVATEVAAKVRMQVHKDVMDLEWKRLRR